MHNCTFACMLKKLAMSPCKNLEIFLYSMPQDTNAAQSPIITPGKDYMKANLNQGIFWSLIRSSNKGRTNKISRYQSHNYSKSNISRKSQNLNYHALLQSHKRERRNIKMGNKIIKIKTQPLTWSFKIIGSHSTSSLIS